MDKQATCPECCSSPVKKIWMRNHGKRKLGETRVLKHQDKPQEALDPYLRGGNSMEIQGLAMGQWRCWIQDKFSAKLSEKHWWIVFLAVMYLSFSSLFCHRRELRSICTHGALCILQVKPSQHVYLIKYAVVRSMKECTFPTQCCLVICLWPL